MLDELRARNLRAPRPEASSQHSAPGAASAEPASHTAASQAASAPRKPCRASTVFLAWLLGGLFGVHHLTLRRPLHFLLCATSLNGLGFGWLVDLLSLRRFLRQSRGLDSHRRAPVVYRRLAALLLGCLHACLASPLVLLLARNPLLALTSSFFAGSATVWAVDNCNPGHGSHLGTVLALGVISGWMLPELLGVPSFTFVFNGQPVSCYEACSLLYCLLGASFGSHLSERRRFEAESSDVACTPRGALRAVLLLLLLAGAAIVRCDAPGLAALAWGYPLLAASLGFAPRRQHSSHGQHFFHGQQYGRQSEWEQRQRQQEHQAAREGGMDPYTAARLLGVRLGSSPERVKAAHRKASLVSHPDKQAGSGKGEDAQVRLNQARDALLAHYRLFHERDAHSRGPSARSRDEDEDEL